MKYLLESWKAYTEDLSKKEKDKRRKKKLHPSYIASDEIVPPELQRLGRGIITASNDAHDADGLFSDLSTDGSYSDGAKQGERKGKTRGASQSRCGRKKRPDGHKYKCKDGTLREDELELPTDIDAAYIKGTVEQAVKKAVKAALMDRSHSSGSFNLQRCLRTINAVNKSEDGKLNDKPKKTQS